MMENVEENQNQNISKYIESTRKFYGSIPSIKCPYFQGSVILNSDGFNHLLYKPNRQPRNVKEQVLKLSLLKKAIAVIQKSGTVQEIRERIEKVGKPARDGFTKTKVVKYWGFHAIVGTNRLIKIVVVIKRIGEGNFIFWSVLPYRKLNMQKLYSEGIEQD